MVCKLNNVDDLRMEEKRWRRKGGELISLSEVLYLSDEGTGTARRELLEYDSNGTLKMEQGWMSVASEKLMQAKE